MDSVLNRVTNLLNATDLSNELGGTITWAKHHGWITFETNIPAMMGAQFAILIEFGLLPHAVNADLIQLIVQTIKSCLVRMPNLRFEAETETFEEVSDVMRR